ncbi:MAG: asparagine synthase (glutamine-hydrolyzing) [Planctomycetes bacterium]|nr:asparagine synthase (glutamine-hydrolyzing) [Planctomycetota bacterium]
MQGELSERSHERGLEKVKKEEEALMCGIAGIINHHQPEPEPAVAGMVKVMRHRGPDDEGFFSDERACLGMCRLAIRDLSGGKQPMSTPDGRYHLVYNGECYGIAGLRQQLEDKGASFRTRSDTEVVLQAYAHLGPEGLNSLNGMFAFAIWDSQEQELFLARDRMGIKPLCYSFSKERFLFASTLNGLQAHPDFHGSIDPEAVELYLSTGFIPAPYTIFKEARKLPPGHWARIGKGGMEIRRWWEFPLPRGEERLTDAEEACDRIAGIIKEAATIRLESDRPVGLCLSGGIDSGLLASALQDSGTEAFTVGFAEKGYDESGMAARVTKHLEMKHHILSDCHISVEEDFDKVLEHYDEPNNDSSAMAVYNLARLLHQHVVVELNGLGGDEAFGGYLRYIGGRWAPYARYLPGLGLLPGILGPDEIKSSWKSRLARFGEAVGEAGKALSSLHLPGELWPLACYLQMLNPSEATIDRRLRRPEFLRQLGGFRAIHAFAPHFQESAGCSLLTRLNHLDCKTVLPGDYLVKEDRMTMAHSVEGRVPLLDHRIIKLGFSLSDPLRIKGLRTKRMLRLLASKQLPEGVADAPKHGFSIPEAAWLRGPLAGKLQESLFENHARVYEYVAAATVKQVLREHLDGRANHSRLLWTLFSLETWLRNRKKEGVKG